MRQTASIACQVSDETHTLTGTYDTAGLGARESARPSSAETISQGKDGQADPARGARVLDEERKQVEAGNGTVPNSTGGRARTMDFRARVVGYAGNSAP
jgi:hypothetical protein